MPPKLRHTHLQITPMKMNRKIPIALAWLQLVVSGAVIAVVLLGYVSFVGTSSESGNQITISASNSLRHAKESMKDANSTLEKIKTDVPGYVENLKRPQEVLDQLARISYSLADNLNFQAPTSIEMQGIKPIVVMSRPLASNAASIKVTGDQIMAAAVSTKNVQSTLVELPKLFGDLQNTLISTSELLDGLEPVINKLESTVNWGTAIALLFAAWCFMNSLTTLSLAKSLTASRSE